MIWRALRYGLVGFGLGFVFGTLRELAFVPWLGARNAALIEFPMLLVAILMVAYCMFCSARSSTADLLAVGALAVAILLALESTLALVIFRQPLDVYLRSFDVTKGALFPFGLLVMALAPWVFGAIGSRQRHPPHDGR